MLTLTFVTSSGDPPASFSIQSSAALLALSLLPGGLPS